eukprot:scaffold7557_cov128-Isochrysis_galbana.AAC.1
MDASTFYMMIFGSEGFEAFIGELQLASLFSASEEDEVSLKLMGHKQRMREATCATELAKLLGIYVRGDAEAFASEAKAKAQELATTAFGEVRAGWFHCGNGAGEGDTLPPHPAASPLPAKVKFRPARLCSFVRATHPACPGREEARTTCRPRALGSAQDATGTPRGRGRGTLDLAAWQVLVHTIGRVYSSKARLFLQKNDMRHLGGAGEAMRARGHSINTHVSAATSVVRMYREGKKLKGKEEDEEAMAATMDPRSMATMMEAAWRLCVVDVEATLRKACKKVLGDTSVSLRDRAGRAQALLQLGAVFLAAVSPENARDGPKKSFRQQLEAFVATMMPPPAGDAAAQAAAAEAAAEQGGLLGRRVVLRGLEAKPELNGRTGVAVQFDAEKG